MGSTLQGEASASPGAPSARRGAPSPRNGAPTALNVEPLPLPSFPPGRRVFRQSGRILAKIPSSPTPIPGFQPSRGPPLNGPPTAPSAREKFGSKGGPSQGRGLIPIRRRGPVWGVVQSSNQRFHRLSTFAHARSIRSPRHRTVRALFGSHLFHLSFSGPLAPAFTADAAAFWTAPALWSFPQAARSP